jgi:peroxiredoxin
MKIRLVAYLTILFAVGFSLNASAQLMNNLTISGKALNTNARTVYLAELTLKGMKPVDTGFINEKGLFQIYTDIDQAGYFQLSFGQKQYSILVLEPNEHIKIEVDANNMLELPKVAGSPNTEYVVGMLKDINAITKKQDSLNNLYRELVTPPQPQPVVKGKGTAPAPTSAPVNKYTTEQKDSIGKVLAAEYERLDDVKVEYIVNSIDQNPCLGSMLFLDQLSIDQYLDLYVKVDSVLFEKYPTNPFVLEKHAKVAAKLKLAIGRPAPEIALPDTNNQIVKLSDFKGKVVLIDFWASWCGPCRRESPHMVKLYQKYNEFGFEILSVSLDKKKSDWMRGIKEDELYWTHISDLRYLKCAAAQTYGVGSIPFTVLVDENGNILALNLRGAELERKLDEIFME